jgi:hypothetical protein
LLASRTVALIATATFAVIVADAGVAIDRSSSHHDVSGGATPISPGAPTFTAGPTESPTTGPSASPGTTPTASPTEHSRSSVQLAALLSQTFTRALAQHTVHSVARNVSAKDGTTVFDDYDGVAVGEQRIAIDGGYVAIRVVGPETYLSGNYKGLRIYGFKKQEVRALHGQWLPFVAGQPGYHVLTVGVTISSTLNEDELVGPLRQRPEKTLDGEQVFGISGHGAGGGTATGDPVTMWISEQTGLPVEFDAASRRSQITETFTDWGKPIRVATPANVVGQPGLTS